MELVPVVEVVEVHRARVDGRFIADRVGLLRQTVVLPCSLALFNAGRVMAAMTAMTPMTTINSIRVKPDT